MELQNLYSRILTLLRNEFLAVKWRVYLEEDKHRLIIEKENHLTLDARFRRSSSDDVDAIKLENGLHGLLEDRSFRREDVDERNGFHHPFEVKREEFPASGDPLPVPNYRDEELRRERWETGSGEEDEGDGDILGSAWDDNEYPDSPIRKKVRKTASQKGTGKMKRAVDGGDLRDDDGDDGDLSFGGVDGLTSLDDWTSPPPQKSPSKSSFCTICHKYFSSKSYLAKHSLNVHNVEIPQPSRDSKGASEDTALKDEENRLDGGDDEAPSSSIPEELSVCPECGVTFSTASQLMRHRRITHGVGGGTGKRGGGGGGKAASARPGKELDLRCWEPECDGKRVFSSRSKFNKHTLNVHGVQIKLKCTECDAEFLTRKGRIDHVKAVHDGVKIQCLHCEKKFTKQRNLNYHMDNSHPELVDPSTLTHICDLCGKIFSSGDSLYIHQMAKHRDKDEIATRKRKSKSKENKDGVEGDKGEESVGCPICGRQFSSNKSYLKEGDEVCQCVGTVPPDDGSSLRNNRRGQQKRASYSVEKKAEVILDAYKSGLTQGKIAAKYKINRSMVSVWMRDKDKIMDAARKTSKKFSRLRPYTKHAQLFESLNARLRDCRLQGRLADFGWLWAEARKIHAELTSNPDATLCGHVVILFLKRYGVRLRAKAKFRKLTRDIYEPKMHRWHADLREKLVRVGKTDFYDRKWGRFLPSQRYALDSCVLPIYLSRNRIVDHYKSGEDVESKDKICLTDPSHGLDRRHCSLFICLRAAGEQPRLAVIFRGGRRFGADEKTLWNPDIDVYFQEKASVDTAIACEWVKHTLSKSIERGSGARRFVLFCGNSPATRSPEFEGLIADRGGVVWHGFEDAAASLWQPVEAGPAQLLKVLVGQAQRTWLETPENAQLWHGETKGFTARDRRILITHWAAQAWKKFVTDEYSQFKLNAWQKTGCLMTADGSDDVLIKPEDLGTEYAVPLPSPYEPYLQVPQRPEMILDDEESTDSSSRLLAQMRSDVGVPPEFLPDESPPRDDPADRDFNHELVGRQLKVWYEDGWASGKISYYNINFGMMKVDFPEDADFVAPHDIDGIEVVLL